MKRKENKMYEDLTRRLRQSLFLEHMPVVIGLSADPPSGLDRFSAKSIKACQMIDTVRFEGISFYTFQDDHYECKNAILWLGFGGSYEGHLSGEWAAGDYPERGRAIFKTAGACRRMYMQSPQLVPETVKVVYYAPLEKANSVPVRGDEVVVIICNPKQALYLARASIYETGGLSPGMTGPGTCVSAIIAPYVEGKLYYTLGCFGARQFMKVKTEELFVGIPIEILPSLVENLELLLTRRPDLKEIVKEGIGIYHMTTTEEVEVQKAKGTFED
jgi:uncharacterized protein (DUF169 family)